MSGDAISNGNSRENASNKLDDILANSNYVLKILVDKMP